MDLIDGIDSPSDRNIFNSAEDSKIVFVENETEVKAEIDEKIIEQKLQDEIEEDILIEIN